MMIIIDSKLHIDTMKVLDMKTNYKQYYSVYMHIKTSFKNLQFS